jgi:hypothetical protein
MSSSSINFASVGNLGGYQGTDWTDAGASSVTAVSGGAVKGTIVTDSVKWRREGGDMILRWDYEQSATGTAGTGRYILALPGGYTIDTTKQGVSTTDKFCVGYGYFSNNADSLSGTSIPGSVMAYDSTHLSFVGLNTVSTQTQIGASLFSFANTANIKYTVFARVPISGWTSSTPNGSLVSAYSGTQVGAGGGWTNNTNTAYVDFSAATTSNTLTQILSQNITAVAEATKMPAITCTLPSTGIYLVTASGSGSSNGANAAFFRLVDGSGTIINGGQEANVALSQFGPFTLTGLYNATGTTVTFKLQGAATAGNANIAQDTQRPITWSVVKLN